MGYEYFKRPIRSVVGESTFHDLTVEETLTLQTDLVLPTQSLTASAALQNLASTAVVHILTQGTSGAGRDFRLPAPTLGTFKIIAVNANTTSPDDLRIVCNTTAQTFFGSTFNQIGVANSTAAATKGRHVLMLVGVSTSQWAVLPGHSTLNWVLSATTGSTGQ